MHLALKTTPCLAALCAAVWTMCAAPAFADRPKRLDMDLMDANGDGLISRSEWMSWFIEDIEAHSEGLVRADGARSAPEVEITDAQGVRRRLVARPFSATGAGPVEEDVDFGDQRASSPIAARNRLLREQADPRPFPDFDLFDTDGDGFVSRDEMPILPATSPDPIPVQERRVP